MQPGFQPGDILVGRKTKDLKPGDICSFYFNNKLILKRIIAMGGDIVEISEEGRVRVNGTELEEPYVSEYALGQCDLEFPFEVPLNTVFVLGDNRDNSGYDPARRFSEQEQELAEKLTNGMKGE